MTTIKIRTLEAGRPPTLLSVGVGILVGMALVIGWRAYGSMASSASAPEANQPGQSGCRTFTQTGHKVCGRFLQYWIDHGGFTQQGYPLSEEFVETSPLNGKPYTVQYFERSVFELHPENKPPYDVLLSQLGTYLARARYVQGFPRTAGTVPFYEDRTDPVAALLSFYNAINRKEYERAYGYFRGAPNPDASLAGPYDPWKQGYADTASVTVAVGKVQLGAAAGNLYANFPVVITATHTNAGTEVFAGCYTMHRVNEGISLNPNDELWSISSAVVELAPANTTVDKLLARTCSP
jgi:hypothetical protein